MFEYVGLDCRDGRDCRQLRDIPLGEIWNYNTLWTIASTSDGGRDPVVYLCVLLAVNLCINLLNLMRRINQVKYLSLSTGGERGRRVPGQTDSV